MQYVLDGWPGTTNECAEPAHTYFTYREELTIIDGLLVKGNRIVCTMTVFETLHASHLGVNKTLMRAHTSVFWPGMTADITALPTALHAKSSSPNSHLKPSGMCYQQLNHGQVLPLIYLNLMDRFISLL